MSAVLILLGAGFIYYGIWQLRQLGRGSGAAGQADTLADLALDLSTAAAEAAASLDTRLQRLEELIRHADARLALLEPGSKVDSARTAQTAAAAQTTAAPAAAAIAPPKKVEVEAEVPPKGATARLRQQILALAETGAPETDIALQLGVPRGEVNLVLGLQRRPTSPSGGH